MSHTYIAKADSIEAIKDRLSKGADMIEVQLLKHNLGVNFDEYADKIFSVHSLLDNNSDEISLENSDKRTLEQLRLAFELGDRLGKLSNKKVGVIIHNGIGLDKMNKLGVIEYTFTRIERLLREFENTELFLENSSLACKNGIYNTDLLSDELIEVVKELKRRSTCSDRIYGLLDVVHAMSSSRILELIYAKDSDLTYENYFKDYAEYTKEIHFANIINKGLSNHEHGVSFREGNEKDDKFFDMTVSLIDKYMPNVNICLELKEDDYSNAVNFEYVLKRLREAKLDEK